jgi:hypothetical protein
MRVHRAVQVSVGLYLCLHLSVPVPVPVSACVCVPGAWVGARVCGCVLVCVCTPCVVWSGLHLTHHRSSQQGQEEGRLPSSSICMTGAGSLSNYDNEEDGGC